MWNGEVGNFVTYTVTEFLFLHFVPTGHAYLPVLFQTSNFYFHLFPLVFAHCQKYIKKKVAIVVVAVVEAAVGSVELQGHRDLLSAV